MLADGSADGALPANAACGCSATAARSAAACASRRRWRASSARGPSASSRTCARSTRCSARRSSRPLGIPLVLWFTHWRASPLLRAAAAVSTAVASVDRRSFPLDSSKVHAIGHGIDLAEFPCRDHRVARRPPAARARALLAGEGARDDPARAAPLARPRARRSPDRARPDALRAGARAPPRARGAAGRASARRPGGAGRAGRPLAGAGAPRGERPAREQHARRCARQGRLRGGGELHARARVEPGLRRRCCPTSCASPREDPAELAARIIAFAERSADDRAALGRALRATRRARALRRVLGEGHPGADAMRSTVLHLAKVAGISGLGGAPALAPAAAPTSAAGTSASCMLHENEPGAWEFADELRARGVPVDAIPLRADVDPLAFARVARVPRALAADDPAHAPRPRRRLRPGRRRGRAVPLRVEHEARLQRVPREPRLRARRPHDRRARAPPHRDLARARALPLRDRGLRRDRVRDRPLRDRPRTRAEARAGGAARALHRPADPDQGPRRAAARVLAEARKEVPELTLDLAGRGPLEPALKALAKELGIEDAVRFLGYVSPIARRDRRRGDRRRALARRGLRDGRARGDGARAPRDRGRDRRARRARRRRRDRPARPDRPRPSRSPRRSSSWRATPRYGARWAKRAARGRSSTSPSTGTPSGPSCSTASS